MKEIDSANKVYKQYSGYISQDEQNILSEPEAVYAAAFNDMIAVSDYDKDFAADL